jgi:uncharacterized SAM-binding protein YcdF (DUF218 family)
MTGFIYSFFTQLLEPVSLCLILLLASAVFRKRKIVGRVLFCLAIAILYVSSSPWGSRLLLRNLESRYQPPNPVPQADCIVVLGGGILSATPPRPTVEVAEAGNRVLYTAYLFRQGRAPWTICTGGRPGGRPEAEDMAQLLEMSGVPKSAIIKEVMALNTHEHAVNLSPLFQEHGFKRVLMVTSAAHMPRSVGVFKHFCPGIEFIPAPTDFRVVAEDGSPWQKRFFGFMPDSHRLADSSDAIHEYMGMAYYKLRGWM